MRYRIKNELTKREFPSPEIQMEYEIEKAKELARADAAVEYENVKLRNRMILQDKFIYTTTPYIILTCLSIIVAALK